MNSTFVLPPLLPILPFIAVKHTRIRHFSFCGSDQPSLAENVYIQVALELPTPEKREQELLPLRKCDDFFRKMIIVRGNDPLHFTGDGIMEVGSIPFLLDKTILDKALAD